MNRMADGGMRTTPGQPYQSAYKLGKDSANGVKGLAITQIVMGTLCILFEIVLVALYHSGTNLDNGVNGHIAPGIWNGLFILIIGIIGVLTATQNTRGWIIAYMVINIIAAVEMPTFITLSGIATGESADCGYSFWYSQRCDTYAPLALNILNLLMAISQFIITIVAASLCCGPACCSSTGQIHTTMVIHGQQQQQQATTTMVVGGQVYSFGTSQSGYAPPQTFGQPPPAGVGYGYGVVQPPIYQQQQQAPVYSSQHPPNYYSQQQPANSGPPGQSEFNQPKY